MNRRALQAIAEAIRGLYLGHNPTLVSLPLLDGGVVFVDSGRVAEIRPVQNEPGDDETCRVRVESGPAFVSYNVDKNARDTAIVVNAARNRS